ncbi:MAG: carboxypeptidase regulatory-like domain-containing protein [Vicinamibacteria bacterium]
MRFVRLALPTLLSLGFLAVATPLVAQQTGVIAGRVTATDGSVLPGVVVEARSEVLPGPRSTVTGANGDYRLPALPPGAYTVTYALSGMQTQTRKAQVQLSQETVADVTLGAGLAETVTVTAESSLVDKDSATIASGITSEEISALPVGQEYRDLQKLIPGVQYSQDQVRGPSAGGSGQDNVYQFDGVNVTLPLFGTLSAEPASHDIDQVTVVKGGARAVDFDRSGGFSIDTVSKTGTSQFHGQASFQLQSNGMAADLDSGSQSRYNQDRTWTTGNLSGPVIKDRLYFYASYYRPTRTRDNRSNLYGELPDYDSTRNEGFGKLTFTPTKAILLNASYRESKRVDKSDLFAANAAPTTGTGSEGRLKIFTGEGSWVISSRSFATAKYTHFTNLTQGRPDNVANVDISTSVGTKLDVTTLDQQGLVTVPTTIAGQTAYNAFVQPLIDRYGYEQNGARVGGGTVGYGTQFDNDDFYRDAFQVGYNLTLGRSVVHELHVGYQWYVDSEDLERSSNGWGAITAPGGRTSFQGKPIFYQTAFQQQTTGLVPVIHSEYRSQSIEFNDTIRWGRFTFNAGLLASNDTLYGQGLREDSGVLSGYVLAPGNKYKMYETGFGKMLQPRLGATWAYNGRDTVYASYARYNPAASSLPRAASWDRNLATTIRAYFDANGILFATDPVASSSGKLFVEDMTPRRADELLIGTARQLGPRWSARLYGRYRKGSHFWEDTNNDARVKFNPPAGIPRELYISDLAARRAQIGSGSSYVIAELDGAYTKYWEATAETEWRGAKTFVRGSYTWSKYYGNFDQDNSTVGNDANIFIGSSNIADDAGRQLWDFKDGTLRGDRPHMLKVYGTRQVPWRASFGAFFVFQSGQPWEQWNYEPYRTLTTSTNESNRYAEKAGSRRSDSHWQLDLNYTQNVRLRGRLNLQIAADLFNVFDEQTGYDIEPRFHNSLYGQPRLYFDPRRLQVAGRLQF